MAVQQRKPGLGILRPKASVRPSQHPYRVLEWGIVWVYVDIERAFQSQTLVAGSNLIALE